jgi:methionyl-tRNA synthetase
MIKKCEVCGAEYLPRNANTKYCVTCRIEVKREQDREVRKNDKSF